MKARNVVFGIITISLVVFLYLALKPAAVSVDVALVDEGPLMVSVADEGRTRVRELYEISSPISARLLRLDVEVGDTVRAGETVVATLLPTAPSLLDGRRDKEAKATIAAATAALSHAQSEVERTKAELKYAVSDEKRVKELARTNAASAALLDRAQLARRSAEARLNSAKSNARMRIADRDVARAALIDPNDAGSSLGTVQIKAPVDGVVLKLLHESEGVVASGMGLLQIGDLSQTEIVADFLSRSAVKVQAGSDVIIEGWGGDPIAGRVRLVEPYGFTKISALGVEEQRVNIIIDFIDRSKSAALGHGFRVEPRIVIWQSDKEVRVPTSALFRDQGKWAVFEAGTGDAVKTMVEIGQVNGKFAQVLSGLTVGQLVIEHPSEMVRDGVSIKVRD